jgi:hypothetical protein
VLVDNVVPEPSRADGGVGRIGVSLTPRTYIDHIRGASVAENLAIANKEFGRCVLLLRACGCSCHNFNSTSAMLLPDSSLSCFLSDPHSHAGTKLRPIATARDPAT